LNALPGIDMFPIIIYTLFPILIRQKCVLTMEQMMKQEAVLVVDDEPQASLMMTELVISCGFQCEAVNSKETAMDIIEKRRFDIVIADIKTMEGLHLISDVRKIQTDVPFVVITGYSGFTYESIVTAGANDFIKKPFTKTELNSKLSRILKERRLALENSQLLLKQIAANKKISNLLEIALDLTAEVEFANLFPLIISRVTKVMNAERSSLYLIDWERNEIWTTVAEKVEHFSLPIGEGISGFVAQTGETVNIADAWELPNFKR
jgi:CheY-like chemotaxis protein